MSLPKLLAMSPCNSMSGPADAAGEPAAAAGGEPGAAPAASAAPRNGRGRRVRFGDAIPDAPPRATTGSIAISFAVVSRRHWPR
ncbi:hypothetical protein WT15_29460 [Burkholderia stagnalis]|nr:hypothetical protein [Burkholderia stagnalis]AOK57563.1 hypothetical protein WT74_27810 [Burkholderia stagnalis]KVN70632.1 hypothetical protein WT15_29460 [Burkholderia stagnalis]KWO33364.1 hypothetical protein WT96_21920 [Burkholderia stagnalis]KWO33616.1 hypothetical protein WT95_12915 [Burkholderia stagnalis]